MASEYLAELQLRIPEETDTEKLESYISQAVSEVRNARNYLDDTETTESRWFYTIIELAEYFYDMNGVSGESRHTEGDIDRTYKKKSDILSGISSIARSV